MDPEEARHRFAAERVVVFGSADRSGTPHLVPVTFALPDTGAVVFAVDHKPKSTTRLKRLANVRANPAVALLAQRYADDWTQLWWVRADAQAVVLEAGDERNPLAVRALQERYPQYADRAPDGPVVWCEVVGWSGWAFSSRSGS